LNQGICCDKGRTAEWSVETIHHLKAPIVDICDIPSNDSFSKFEMLTAITNAPSSKPSTATGIGFGAVAVAALLIIAIVMYRRKIISNNNREIQ